MYGVAMYMCVKGVHVRSLQGAVVMEEDDCVHYTIHGIIAQWEASSRTLINLC